MPEKGKIIQKKDYAEIINTYFSENQAYLKDKLFNYKIKFLSYEKETAKFEIDLEKLKLQDEDQFLIFSRDKDSNALIVNFEKISSEGLTVSFKALEVKNIAIKRKEERVNLLQLKNRIYISNLVADFVLKEFIENEQKIIEKIKIVIHAKLEKVFKRLRIFFLNEKRDPRYDYFQKNISTIFMDNIKKPEASDSTEILDFYKTEIFDHDSYLKANEEFISEISVPIIYKMKLPYGFIQANHTEPLNDSHLKIIKKLAIITDNLIAKHSIIKEFTDRILVSDVSPRGLGFIFKEKKYIKYFKENTFVYLDLFLPDNIKANLVVKTRNISFVENNIRIGCEIKDIDALSEVYFDEFYEGLKKTKAE